MTVYTGTHKGFACYGHRYGSYAVRDGEEPGKPAGPNYAHVEVDEDGDISAAIEDYLYFEAMPTEDLMEQVAEEMKWSGRPGLASAELSKRGGRAAA